MFHVKHEPQQITQPSVIEALRVVGVVVTPEQARLLVEHASLVLRTNETTNLTRITDPAEMLQRHIVDSLAFLPLIEPLSGNVIDIGAGAGYPGIPLAIVGVHMSLCESVKKKAAFLAEAVTSLGIDTSVYAERAEELALKAPHTYDAVIARALSSLPALVELAAPLLKMGGRLVALKGTPAIDEERDGLRAAELCGMRLASSDHYALPGGDSRSVYAYERIRRASLKLPRRSGMAQRHPLG